ncbi:MAG: DUF1587 domain-containing protein [Gemmataceae bacterium]
MRVAGARGKVGARAGGIRPLSKGWLGLKNSSMKPIKIALLLVLGSACVVPVADGQETRINLATARELGRGKSRYLIDPKAAERANDSAPKANLLDFQKSVAPILTKSCVGCHGPKKAKGRLRIDQLNPDLLAGPDAEKWREVYGALGKSEMPPENEPDYALSSADRSIVVDWLGEELSKASLVRRNSKNHSSFRRLTKYEYDSALRDLLGLPYPLANKLPPESVTEDGFKNNSELLQMSAMQFEAWSRDRTRH